tara:strand:- start:2893 stop:4245 length:1353 start_codon:yes stop_codon:yes gene_type:complete
MRNFLKLISFTSALLLAGISNQIYSSEQKKIDLNPNILISNATEEKEIKTVTANGFGTTIESAAQNAAENALTNVVGSFLDVETILKEKTEITNGILNESTIIKENINDYSQGSIKYFEILNVEEKDSIYIVTARVDVRIDDFKAYIKNLSSAKVQISKGLFADAVVSEENLENKIKFIKKKSLEISRGEVIDIKVGEIKLLKNFDPANEEICLDYLKNKNSVRVSYHPCDGKFLNREYSGNLNKTIIIPVTLNLRENFYQNLITTLDNIADKKVIYANTKPSSWDISKKHNECMNSEESPEFMVNIGNNYSGTIYCLGGITAKLNRIARDPNNSLCILKCSSAFDPDYAYRYAGANLWHRLQISYINTENQIFKQNIIDINDKYESSWGGMKVFNVSGFPWQPIYTLLGRYNSSSSIVDIAQKKIILLTTTLEIDELKNLSNIIVEVSQ